MESLLFGQYIDLNMAVALQVVALGFIGGILSGFIGSGGAFFMTPGMMNLGAPGVVAVASNITHKYGKAMVGSRRHGEMGNVDKRLSLYMVITSFIGIRIAVWINTALFKMEGDSHGASTGAGASDLYISAVFVCILSVVAISMLRDVMKSGEGEGAPSRKLADFLGRIYLPPYVHLKVADVRVSLWIILIAGLATGYLAGTGEVSFENMKRAVIFGSVMASFCVEDFSLNRIKTLTTEEINIRLKQFADIVDFEVHFLKDHG